VGRRLREAARKGHVVTLKVKYSDFELVTRRLTLPVATDDGEALYQAARSLLARTDLGRPVRLVGVSASGFAEGPPEQLGLFGGAKERSPRRAALNQAVDELAGRFGAKAVRPASLLDGDTFGRDPDEDE